MHRMMNGMMHNMVMHHVMMHNVVVNRMMHCVVYGMMNLRVRKTA